jgi:hypothetical protein
LTEVNRSSHSILLPGFVAVGSGLLAFYIMQSRMEVALAREREAMAQARGTMEAEKNSLEQALRGAKDSARREALDEFLADVHVEQRHYVKDNKLLFQNRKALVLQERIFFRNIPLSNWIEHEIVLQEGEDVDKAARSLTSFVDVVGVEQQALNGNRLLR